MRIITKIIPLFIVGILLAGITTQAKAQMNPFADFKFPEVKTAEWAAGQSATYNMNIEGVPDVGTIGGNLRLAVVGKETIEGKPFYWLEYGISNLTGLPPEADLFQTLKFKVLIAYIPPEKVQEDPKALMKDFATGKIMRKLVFQLNDDAPQEIDMMLIQSMAQGMMGMSLEDMVDQIPMDDKDEGIDMDIPGDVTFNTGTENITVKGGSFTNAGFVEFTAKDELTHARGKVHAHQNVPICGLVKMVMNFKESGEDVDIDMNFELINYQMSGAQSQITGTPQPFDFGQLFGMMGGGF